MSVNQSKMVVYNCEDEETYCFLSTAFFVEKMERRVEWDCRDSYLRNAVRYLNSIWHKNSRRTLEQESLADGRANAYRYISGLPTSITWLHCSSLYRILIPRVEWYAMFDTRDVRCGECVVEMYGSPRQHRQVWYDNSMIYIIILCT